MNLITFGYRDVHQVFTNSGVWLAEKTRFQALHFGASEKSEEGCEGESESGRWTVATNPLLVECQHYRDKSD